MKIQSNTIKEHLRTLFPAIALIWAGVSLGGNLIAAPAKFFETDLSMLILLQVGHAQFLWLGYTEWVLMIFLVIICLFNRTKTLFLLAIPVLILVIQQIVLMPALNERTFSLIAGEPVGPSSLHRVFILLECAKLLALVVIGLVAGRSETGVSHEAVEA